MSPVEDPAIQPGVSEQLAAAALEEPVPPTDEECLPPTGELAAAADAAGERLADEAAAPAASTRSGVAASHVEAPVPAPRKLQRKRCVVVMFDTLCRNILPTYNRKSVVIAPNFKKLSEKAVQYDNFYVGSMPCMPARREMHTGRHNFLHRAWGPLEPFDDSMPEMLHFSRIHSHKVTDHYHYWEDGGATYHQRFTTFEFVRGQEGDKWKANVEAFRDYDRPNFLAPGSEVNSQHVQDSINRDYIEWIEDTPQHKTFQEGLDFLKRNHKADNWYLQIETFDPHEPFFTVDEFRKRYPGANYEKDYDGPECDWFDYGRKVWDDDRIAPHLRHMYYSLVTFCDNMLGRVLERFDEYNLWEDTMLIVNTDHGLMMGEDDWWGKTKMPFYNEVAHIPFWIHDPRSPAEPSTRRSELATTVDIPVTVLDFFDLPRTPHMQGRVLRAKPEKKRPSVIFGVFGGQVNITDGKYVYMRGPVDERNQPLFEYTLMPTRMTQRMSTDELRGWDQHKGFNFTKNVHVMRIPDRRAVGHDRHAKTRSTMLFEVTEDGSRQRQVDDRDVEARMLTLLVEAMMENEAPPEQFERLGLPRFARSDVIRKYCVLGTSSFQHASGSSMGLSTPRDFTTPTRAGALSRKCSRQGCPYVRSEDPHNPDFCCRACMKDSNLQADVHSPMCRRQWHDRPRQGQTLQSDAESRRQRQEHAAEARRRRSEQVQRDVERRRKSELEQKEAKERAREVIRKKREQLEKEQEKAVKQLWSGEPTVSFQSLIEDSLRAFKERPPSQFAKPATGSREPLRSPASVAASEPAPGMKKCSQCKETKAKSRGKDGTTDHEGNWYCFKCWIAHTEDKPKKIGFMVQDLVAQLEEGSGSPAELKECRYCKRQRRQTHGDMDKNSWYCFDCFLQWFVEKDGTPESQVSQLRRDLKRLRELER